MTAALIISAGRTDRKNGFSPEKQVGRISAMERIVLQLQRAGIRQIVVIGDERELPQKLVPSRELVFLTASAHGQMLDSIKCGLQYVQKKCRQALIVNVDVPLFTEQTVRALLAQEGQAVVPSFQGRCGHPILLRTESIDMIMSFQGVGGLRGAMEHAGLKPVILETEDPGILAERETRLYDMPTAPWGELTEIRPVMQIRLGKERIFYGPGIHQLLQLTEELGSLSNACQHMGMSYTKGRKIVAVMEEQLGVPVLESRQGGKSGGSSRLTQEAKSVYDSYSAFRDEAEAAVQLIFQKFFPSSREEAAERVQG